MDRFMESVPGLLADVAAVMTAGPLGWLTCLGGFVFMFIALRSLAKGRVRRFVALSVPALVLGILGYFSAFAMEPSYEAMAVLFFSTFVVIVAIATILLGAPVYLLSLRSARRLEQAEPV